LTLVGNIESIHNSGSLGYNLDKILPMKSIVVEYSHLQAEQLQNNPHTDCMKLEMKVQGGPIFDQQSGRLHHTLRKHCHPQ
jgi:hypothetical protein